MTKITKTLTDIIKDDITNSIAIHSGKMTQIPSISTSTALNTQCRKNAAIKGSICSHCYAANLIAFRPSLAEKLARNTKLYTAHILPVESIPFINAAYFRFEAFGDLMNDIQVINYFNIAANNPHCRFALWTKNPHIIAKAIKKGHNKPENMTIIYSSLFVNKAVSWETINKKYSFIDKVFTVYDRGYIKDNNIDINCGGRLCAGCLKCYAKNNIRIINEELK